MSRRSLALLALIAGALALLVAQAGSAVQAKPKPTHPVQHTAKPKPTPPSVAQKFAKIKRIVIIYEENHSFDNLYGAWEGVNGLSTATAAHKTQVNQAGTAFTCLLQVDLNLKSPPLGTECTDTTTGSSFTSHFVNAPFVIDDYITPSDTTCPAPLQAFAFPNGVTKGTGQPGGCTRDLVHEFYQEQYQLNGGQQNRYVTGSDAVGLSMGTYNTKLLPIYKYLHKPAHPHYVIEDNFFQSAFGGSFLNHQWLIAAATPTYPGAPAGLHSIIDSNGMPVSYPLYTPTGTVLRGPITVVCPSPVAGRACGDYAVNTMQPSSPPFGSFGAKLPLQTAPTIGDRLTAKGIDWAWYAGGWANAAGETTSPGYTNGAGPNCSAPDTIPGSTYPACPSNVFQFHHQPFNYFANYAPGTPGRAHLQDEVAFTQLLGSSSKTCGLKPVSFVKPFGSDNEHPGYASEPNGSNHLVSLLQSIEGGACKKDTMVIVAYDEFGGQWDHVSPPGQGSTVGPHDQFGPGTRIPALVIVPNLIRTFSVDHAQHDTTSILATIEHRFGVAALGTRDAAVKDLSTVFTASTPSK